MNRRMIYIVRSRKNNSNKKSSSSKVRTAELTTDNNHCEYFVCLLGVGDECVVCVMSGVALHFLYSTSY